MTPFTRTAPKRLQRHAGSAWLPLALLASACVAPLEGDPGAEPATADKVETVSAAIVGTPGPAESWISLPMMADHDARLFTGDGDWAFGFSKAECGPSRPAVLGISSSNAKYNNLCGFFEGNCAYWYPDQSMLCATSKVLSVDYSRGVTVAIGSGNVRRDTSTGDWAPGYTKAECANDEVVTGVSQADFGAVSFRCSKATSSGLGDKLRATNCVPVNFTNGNASEEGALSPRSDWSPGAIKGQCDPDRYVKGFSNQWAGHSSRRINSILCCSQQCTPDNIPCTVDDHCCSGFCSAGLCVRRPPPR